MATNPDNLEVTAPTPLSVAEKELGQLVIDVQRLETKLADAENIFKNPPETLDDKTAQEEYTAINTETRDRLREKKTKLEIQIQELANSLVQDVTDSTTAIVQKTEKISGLNDDANPSMNPVFEQGDIIGLPTIESELASSKAAIVSQQDLIDENENIIQEYTTTAEDLKKELEKEKAELEKTKLSLTEARNQALEETKSTFTKTYSEINKSFNEDIIKIETEYKNVKDNPEVTLTQLAAARSTADAALDTLNEKTKADLASIKTNYDNSIKEAFETYNNAVESAPSYTRINSILTNIEENETRLANVTPGMQLSAAKLKEETLEKIGISIQKHQEEINNFLVAITEKTKELDIITKINDVRETVANQQIQLQETIIQKLQNDLTQSAEYLKKAEDEISDTQSRIQKSLNMITELRSTNEKLKKEIDKHREKEQSLSKNINETRKLLETLKEKFTGLNTQQKELKNIIAEQKQELQNQNRKIKALNSTLVSNGGKIKAIENEISLLTTNFTKSQRELTTKKEQLNNDVKKATPEEFKKAKIALQQSLENSSQELINNSDGTDKDKQEKIAKMKKDIAELNKNISLSTFVQIFNDFNGDSIASFTNPILQNLQSIQAIEVQLEKDKEEFNKEIQTQQSQIASLQRENLLTELQIHHLSAEVNNLQNSLSANQATILSQNQELSQLNNELKGQGKKYRSLKEQHRETQKQIQLNEDKIKKGESQINQLETTLLHQQTNYSNLDKQIKQFSGKFNDLQKIHDDLNQNAEEINKMQKLRLLRIQDYKSKFLNPPIGYSENKRRADEQKLIKLQKDYSKDQDELAKVYESIAKNSKEMQEVLGNIRTAQQEISNINQQLREMESELLAQHEALGQQMQQINELSPLARLTNLAKHWNMRLFNVELDDSNSPFPRSNPSGTANIHDTAEYQAVYNDGIRLKDQDSGLSYIFKIDKASGNVPCAILGPLSNDQSQKAKKDTANCVINMINNVLANGNEVNINTANPLVAAIAEQYLDYLKKEKNLNIVSSVRLTAGSPLPKESVNDLMPKHFENGNNLSLFQAIQSNCPTPQSTEVRRLTPQSVTSPLQANVTPTQARHSSPSDEQHNNFTRKNC